MQQDILIIGVLFPAIPLMMVNFGNRGSAEIRSVIFTTLIQDSVCQRMFEWFIRINRLRNRLRLTGTGSRVSALLSF